MTTSRRAALPAKTTHPMEDLLVPEPTPDAEASPLQKGPTVGQLAPLMPVPITFASPAAEVQLNVRIDKDVSQAFDRALLTLAAARGRKITKKAGIEEAIKLLIRENNL